MSEDRARRTARRLATRRGEPVPPEAQKRNGSGTPAGSPPPKVTKSRMQLAQEELAEWMPDKWNRMGREERRLAALRLLAGRKREAERKARGSVEGAS
jgi:hypothetical protein